jgi:hypothetical protein
LHRRGLIIARLQNDRLCFRNFDAYAGPFRNKNLFFSNTTSVFGRLNASIVAKAKTLSDASK